MCNGGGGGGGRRGGYSAIETVRFPILKLSFVNIIFFDVRPSILFSDRKSYHL